MAPDWTQYYTEGVPAALEEPTTTVAQILEDAAATWGDRPATRFFGRTTTYGELLETVRRIAAWLVAQGVEPGDRVATVLPNCPQGFAIFHAAARIGAVVVQHNPTYTTEELRGLFADHRAQVAFVWTKRTADVQSLGDGAIPDRIVAVDLIDAMPTVNRLALQLPVRSLQEKRAKIWAQTSGAVGWKSVVRTPPLPTEHPHPAVTDVATIFYTSGTTGKPRGAQLTHRNLVANQQQVRPWIHGCQDGEWTTYAILPFFHAMGTTVFLTTCVSRGMQIVIFPNFDVELVLEAQQKAPANFFVGAPPIFDSVARNAEAKGVDLTSIGLSFCGSMKLPDPLVERWERQTGTPIIEGYGMTETSPVTLVNPANEHRRTGTIGIPVPSTEMKVVDVEDGSTEVARGAEGELMVRGPQVFPGYFDDAAATAEVLEADGFIHTGDVVTVDEKGWSTIVDRKKEIIITGGYNVSPTEVEQVLLTHDDIADAAVVGIERAHGERIVAALLMEDGKTPDRKELRDFCRQHLAEYKIPAEFRAVDDLPKSMLGKTLRRTVRESLTAED